MRYTEYQNERDNIPSYGDVPFAQFAGALEASYTETMCTLDNCAMKDCAHKRGDSWSPGIVTEGLTRAAVHVEAISALVLDLDDVTDEEIERAEHALARYSYIVHGSHSYRGVAPYRIRIIVELKSEIAVRDAAAWKRTYKHAAQTLLGLHVKDESCCNADRLYYLPSGPKGAPRLCYHHAGEPLDLHELLELVPVAVAPKTHTQGERLKSAEPPASVAEIVKAMREIARQYARKKNDADAARVALACSNYLAEKPLLDARPNGAHFQNRENTIHRLCGALAFKLSTSTPSDAIAQLFAPSLALSFCEPEGVDHYVRCVASSFERGQEEKAKRDADEKEIKERVKQGLARSADARCGNIDHSSDRDQATQMAQEDDRAPTDWLARLQTDKQGNFKNNTLNIGLILENNPDLAGAFRFNEVTKEIDVSQGLFAGEHKDTLEIPLASWFNERVQLDASPALLVKHIYRVACMNRFDPLADRLKAIQWDHVSRLETVLENYFNALVIDPATGEDCRAYLRLVGRAWFISAVARALQPGEKVDTALILEGKTGAGKSTIFKKLAYDEYFQDSKINLDNKDSGLVAGRKWIVEMGELSSLKKHDPETIKTFISSSTDSLRAPYARGIEDFPRRAVFVGTTEETDYLESNTNRRFWPVAVGSGEIDIAKVIEDRDQLWGEAVYLFATGEKWYYKESSEEARIIREHVSGRRIEAPLEHTIKAWFTLQKIDKRPLHLTAYEVATKILLLTANDIAQRAGTLKAIATALKALGFGYTRPTVNGQKMRLWITPQTILGSTNATQSN